MKLNISFVPFDKDVEYKVVCFGEHDALLDVIKGVQMDAFCTNVFLSEDKKDS